MVLRLHARVDAPEGPARARAPPARKEAFAAAGIRTRWQEAEVHLGAARRRQLTSQKESPA